ncbi:MAG TPA: hypothetical protein VEC14_09225 [Reyranellaceae bacterium]|nr:hypothetical protein [Reyranellaceae bacterium]
MLKITTIATCMLALGATGALAEGNKYNKAALPAGTAHMHYQQPMQSQMIVQPERDLRGGGTYIVDEYGRHYNERGDRIR